MEETRKSLPVEQVTRIMKVLDPCMDDYLYIMNLKTRRYEISKSAVERFMIPSDDYYLTDDVLAQQVYHKDIPMISAGLDDVIENKTDTHDLEYRWIGRDGQPVWINCRGRVLR